MHTTLEHGLQDLARASCAAATIIEAHSDGDLCRVVVEMGEKLRQASPLREAILAIWMERGFTASISRDGAYLMIDGVGEQDEMALIGQVAEQLRSFACEAPATRDVAGPELAFLAGASHAAGAWHTT